MSGERTRSVKDIFLKKPIPFAGKRDVNWKVVRNLSAALVGVVVLGILIMPAKQAEVTFSEGRHASAPESAPSLEAVSIPQSGRSFHGLNATESSKVSVGSSKQRNGSMIVARDGLDPNSQLHPGSRIKVRLTERAVVSSQAMPVVGIVTEDCLQEGTIAIPRGSKIFGDLSFDSDSKRGQLSWRSIQIGAGRVKQFEAISTAIDGQAGIEGQVHSDALKNSVGQAMTTFIGAYAEGSMERTSFFGNPGGSQNGLKNAVGTTAKYQADRMADRMKKEREWLEVGFQIEFYALLTQSFRFRDPGGSF